MGASPRTCRLSLPALAEMLAAAWHLRFLLLLLPCLAASMRPFFRPRRLLPRLPAAALPLLRMPFFRRCLCSCFCCEPPGPLPSWGGSAGGPPVHLEGVLILSITGDVRTFKFGSIEENLGGALAGWFLPHLFADASLATLLPVLLVLPTITRMAVHNVCIYASKDACHCPLRHLNCRSCSPVSAGSSRKGAAAISSKWLTMKAGKGAGHAVTCGARACVGARGWIQMCVVELDGKLWHAHRKSALHAWLTVKRSVGSSCRSCPAPGSDMVKVD